MLEYIVKLSGNLIFSFTDSHTAMEFAQLAANKRIEVDDDVIMIIRKEEEEVKSETNNVRR